MKHIYEVYTACLKYFINPNLLACAILWQAFLMCKNTIRAKHIYHWWLVPQGYYYFYAKQQGSNSAALQYYSRAHFTIFVLILFNLLHYELFYSIIANQQLLDFNPQRNFIADKKHHFYSICAVPLNRAALWFCSKGFIFVSGIIFIVLHPQIAYYHTFSKHSLLLM